MHLAMAAKGGMWATRGQKLLQYGADGSRQEMADLAVDLGFWISFSGILTFRNAQDLRGVAARVPADRLLCETDSPFLSPHPYRGQRNEPVRTLDVVACLATIRGEAPEAMGERTTVNFEAAFPRLRSV